MNKLTAQSIISRAAVGACLIGTALTAAAGAIHGTIATDSGAPVAGAMITLRHVDGRAESVYSDAQGQYRIDSAFTGPLSLRVRKRYYHDEESSVTLDVAADNNIDVTLAPLDTAQALSDAHPPLSHFSRITFDKDPDAPFSRQNFARDCLSCHALGNAFTRWPRNADGWVPTVQRMHGYMGDADTALIRRRAELLAAAFDGALARSRPEVAVDPHLDIAKIYQWPLHGAVVPHDAEFDPRNGRIYISEMFVGEILETNLESGETLHFKLPADGLPPGGAFTRLGLPAPYGLTVARAPHSLAQGVDGRWYMTDSIGAAITTFDPATRSFENFPIGDGALYPHTVRVDRGGVVWFTIAFTDQIGRFNPKTRDMEVLALPKSPTHGVMHNAVPYGIDIHPHDGSVWYAKLAADKIGRVDPETLAVTEFDSPVRGPRRQRFDASGHLWVAGFSDGAIARIDTTTWSTEIYHLPVLAENEIPAPYALAVHPDTQDIWINDTMLDVAWRFIPEQERFVTYPLPLAGTYTRDFTFTEKGWACTANNPIPAAALEGGVPELICIDAGENDQAALAGR